jgi:hypothetical protein
VTVALHAISEEGLYNYTAVLEEIKVGNGNKMLAR